MIDLHDTGMAFAACLVPVHAVHHDQNTMSAGDVTREEESLMNKWIPISLFLFLGIYLLTTAQAADVAAPAMLEAAGQSAEPADLVVVLSP